MCAASELQGLRLQRHRGSECLAGISHAVAGYGEPAHGVNTERLRRFHHVEHCDRAEHQRQNGRFCERLDAVDSRHLRLLRTVVLVGLAPSEHASTLAKTSAGWT